VFNIEQQAVAVNLAGRQRMLSQRMVKALLQIRISKQAGNDISEELSELKLAFELFDNTLQGFDIGHMTRSGADEEIFLTNAKGENARATISQAIVLWHPLRNYIQQILAENTHLSDETLLPAIRYAAENNLPMLELMNDLTTILEQQTQEEAAKIRIFQGAAFLLALANFFCAFIMYSRRLKAIGLRHNLLDDIINKIPASVLILNESNVILKANHSAEYMFGYEQDGMNSIHVDRLITDQLDNPNARRRDGSTFAAQYEYNSTIMNGQEFRLLTVFDISQHRIKEEVLTSLAYHDLLTRLPNRLLFENRLQLEISHSQRRNLMLAVLFIDLDNFKPVNDTHGHDIGDLLLQDVAMRLKHCLRESDTISRHGGDEFVIIAADIGNLESCERIAKNVMSQLTNPFAIRDLNLHIGCSIGISIFPANGIEPQTLINQADKAMYQAKRAGRNTYRFHSTSSTILQDAPEDSSKGE
jgi:diguanylate cyclase (GGDEF)-like protein